MNRTPGARACALALVLLLPTAVRAATLEVPTSGGDASGVGAFSGWKCPPNDDLTLVIDGGAPIPVASRVARGDTAGVCGNDGRNGFIAQFNFGLLGDGTHTAVVRQRGVAFASSTFNVTTFGQPFLRGAAGTYQLPNFPQPGRTATIEWVEGAQNFVIVGKSGTPAQCPSNGPITNLLLDCSDFGYIYVRGGVAAALSSDGDLAAICATAVGDPDVLCFGGPVTSATTFTLIGGSLNGGPVLPIGAGSSGSIANGGNTLSFTVVLDGEVFPFAGLSYVDTETLAAATAASASVANDALALFRAALRDAADGGATSSDATTRPLTSALDALLESAE